MSPATGIKDANGTLVAPTSSNATFALGTSWAIPATEQVVADSVSGFACTDTLTPGSACDAQPAKKAEGERVCSSLLDARGRYANCIARLDPAAVPPADAAVVAALRVAVQRHLGRGGGRGSGAGGSWHCRHCAGRGRGAGAGGAHGAVQAAHPRAAGGKGVILSI